MLLISRHRFFDLIRLPSEPLLLCRFCPEFRRLPTVPMALTLLRLFYPVKHMWPFNALVLPYAAIVK
jgi:hypothetical protein